MAMPHLRSFPQRSVWTAADLEQLPDDGNRYEVLHGELLVTPQPTTVHQGVAVRLTLMLGLWCRARRGWSVRAPGVVSISESTWLEPDVVLYPIDDYARIQWRDMPVPTLVIEVLSPSTRKRDRHRKRPAYLAHGVREVWIIDEDARILERWTSASEFPVTCRETFEWTIDAGESAIEISWAELFGPAVESAADDDVEQPSH